MIASLYAKVWIKSGLKPHEAQMIMRRPMLRVTRNLNRSRHDASTL